MRIQVSHVTVLLLHKQMSIPRGAPQNSEEELGLHHINQNIQVLGLWFI